MCPSAYETIPGLALTNQNYSEAAELLKQRYGNPQLLINTYMEQFVKLGKIDKSDDVSTQPAFTCSKLTIETLEQGVKYVQS